MDANRLSLIGIAGMLCAAPAVNAIDRQPFRHDDDEQRRA